MLSNLGCYLASIVVVVPLGIIRFGAVEILLSCTSTLWTPLSLKPRLPAQSRSL